MRPQGAVHREQEHGLLVQDMAPQRREPLDEVRLSRGARYPAEGFTPLRRHVLDEQTVLLLPMDGALGPQLRGERAAGATLKAGARLIQD